MVGRPVRFVGADKDDDSSFAEERLRRPSRLAGYESVEFELEPVAAAHYYESTLDHDELILIGDFGGGTSDFSLLRVGPTIRRRGELPEICSATAASASPATPSMPRSFATWCLRLWGEVLRRDR